MDRRLLLVGAIAAVAIVFYLVTDDESSPGDSSLAPPVSLAEEPTTTITVATTTLDPAEAAFGVVHLYWEHMSGDPSGVASILDLPADQLVREVGLAEYSAAYGGTYLADCEAGVVVGDEIIVDCLVEVVDDPLAEAFAIGATPTQFRVRDGRISRVGYLKPYSTVDLALSAYAARNDQAGLEAACVNPDAIYLSDAGVVYNATCGAYMASLVSAVVAEVRDSEACGEDCDAALLNAIRPSRD